MTSPNWKDPGRLASFLQPYDEAINTYEAGQGAFCEQITVDSIPSTEIIHPAETPPYPWANRNDTAIEEHIEVLEDAVKDAITCGKQLVHLARNFGMEGNAAFPPTVVPDFGKTYQAYKLVVCYEPEN